MTNIDYLKGDRHEQGVSLLLLFISLPSHLPILNIEEITIGH